MGEDQVTVIQDDREAAAEIVRCGAPGTGNGNTVIANEIKGGLHDSYHIVQIIARHRQAHTPYREAGLDREAVARIIDVDAQSWAYRQFNQGHWHDRWKAALAKADAILALTSPTSEDAVEREDRVIALLDDVERALKTKGIWGRHFAADAIRTALSNTQPQAPSEERAREALAQQVEQDMATYPNYWPYHSGKDTPYYIRDAQNADVSSATAIRAMIRFATDTQPVAGGGDAFADAGKPIDRAMVLEEAARLLEDAIATGYAAPLNKVDQCEHEKFGWEDCIACYDERLLHVAAAIRQLASSPPEVVDPTSPPI